MPLKRLNRNTPVSLKRQKRRSNPLNRPPQFPLLNQRVNFHAISLFVKDAVVAPVFQGGRLFVNNTQRLAFTAANCTAIGDVL